MPETTHHLDTLLIHAGPHKTGTTSIQRLLSENSALVTEFGFHYPASPVVGGAHHHVPFLLRKWDLALLGFSEPTPSDTPPPLAVVTEIEAWLTGAIETSCSTIIVSAEDFSGLTTEEWREFGRALAEAEQRTSISVATVMVCLTDRDRDERVVSQYSEYLKHGLAQPLSECEPQLRQLIDQRDATTATIAGALARPTMVQRVPFRQPDSGRTFLESWVMAVLGDDVLPALPAGSLTTQDNQRAVEQSQLQLLAFNRINTPESADVFIPFNKAAPADSERSRARQRLSLVVTLFAEHERAEAENAATVVALRTQLSQAHAELLDAQSAQRDAEAALHEVRRTLSWRVTQPLRFAKGLLRGGPDR
jgi:hypothetical protein